MTQAELSEYNVGENLDALMNLDPRGYGVCRILYAGSRKLAGEPTAMRAAKKIHALLRGASGDTTVLIMTGFVLRPHLQPETDGIVGALLLARALITAYGVTPVLSVHEKNLPAVINCAVTMGLHCYDDIQTARNLPLSFAYVAIPVDAEQAQKKTQFLLDTLQPAFVFATECAGANTQGEYHNALGVNMTELEAKQDALFSGFASRGVPTFAVGDLGNEIGMGALADFITIFVPCSCKCGCEGGIVAATEADYLVTATVSDWGVYAIIAALAFLAGDISVLHKAQMEEDVLRECCRCGMVDMTGSLLPAIDGFGVEIESWIVSLMRSTVEYALNYRNDFWFGSVLEKSFYE
ncbi:MAG: DUF4392 domain-containing protein [Treponema sp.]|nr:DUF4392 domain-containing protein [Treponema sp.]